MVPVRLPYFQGVQYIHALDRQQSYFRRATIVQGNNHLWSTVSVTFTFKQRKMETGEMSDLIADLKSIVGDKYCLSENDEREKYDFDATGEIKGRSLAVVRPANTAEVAQIMALANQSKTPVVPMSGNTGLAGGATINDKSDTIILSVDRMDKIIEINPKSHIAKVEAGVILANIQSAVEAHDLVFPLIFGARESCMIGGNLSTNAGGANVVRYGNTRAQCLGVEVVTPDGQILNLMSELHKDNTGYDLKDLYIGAEGTLGVITAAVLKLQRKPKAYATAMVSVSGINSALSLLHKLQAASGNGVEAFEYLPENYFIHLAQVHPETKLAFDPPAKVALLIEIAATADRDSVLNEDGTLPVQETLTEILAELMESGEVLDANIAQNEAQRREFWQQRENVLHVLLHQGWPLTSDACVPLDRIDEFLTKANAGLAKIAPQAELIEIGHLGDGNIHYSMWVNPETKEPADKATSTAIHMMVEDVLQEVGGSFSAEHGIGNTKLGSMERRKDKASLAVMRTIKAALDPNNIMNPGKVLP